MSVVKAIQCDGPHCQSTEHMKNPPVTYIYPDKPPITLPGNGTQPDWHFCSSRCTLDWARSPGSPK